VQDLLSFFLYVHKKMLVLNLECEWCGHSIKKIVLEVETDNWNVVVIKFELGVILLLIFFTK